MSEDYILTSTKKIRTPDARAFISLGVDIIKAPAFTSFAKKELEKSGIKIIHLDIENNGHFLEVESYARDKIIELIDTIVDHCTNVRHISFYQSLFNAGEKILMRRWEKKTNS